MSGCIGYVAIFRLSNRWWTAKELAKAEGVTVRAVQKFLTRRRMEGIPVIQERRGKVIAYRIEQGWIQREFLKVND